MVPGCRRSRRSRRGSSPRRKQLADFDVLCLQEIADNFPGSAARRAARARTSSRRWRRCCPASRRWRASRSIIPAEGGRRRRFGNLILSRLPVRQAYRHLLPSPIDPGLNGMPRIAVEACVAAPFGDVRVITTHLEYYSGKQRAAQVEALRAIHAEGYGHARAGSIVDDERRAVPHPSAAGADHRDRRLQSRARRSAARADDGAVRRRHAAVRRRVGVVAPGRAAPQHVQDLREGNPRRARAALRLHLRERRPEVRASRTCASIARRRRPTTSRSS